MLYPKYPYNYDNWSGSDEDFRLISDPRWQEIGRKLNAIYKEGNSCLSQEHYAAWNEAFGKFKAEITAPVCIASIEVEV